MRVSSILFVLALSVALVACGEATPATGTPATATGEIGGAGATAGATATAPTTAVAATGPSTAAAPTTKPADVESKDILARAVVAPTGEVKHILVAWSELGAAYGGRLDPRAAARSKDQADSLAWDLFHEVKAAKVPIEMLMAAYSEDPGSARTGRGYPYSPEAGLVPPFKDLSMRLNLGEVGIVRTDFGWHIIVRTR